MKDPNKDELSKPLIEEDKDPEKGGKGAAGAGGASAAASDLTDYSSDKINNCYLWSLLIVVSFGTIQFGYMIGSWNAASGAYGKKEGWNEDELTAKIVIV